MLVGAASPNQKENFALRMKKSLKKEKLTNGKKRNRKRKLWTIDDKQVESLHIAPCEREHWRIASWENGEAQRMESRGRRGWQLFKQ